MKVFVSSTYEDLKEYRAAVRDAVIGRELTPMMMEYIMPDRNPSKADVFEIIKQSDIFIGIYAYCYYQISEAEMKSAVEQEYEYALKNEKPTYCFMHDKNFQNEWPQKFVEDKPELKKFHTKIMSDNKDVKFFRTPGDLKFLVYELLANDKLPKSESKTVQETTATAYAMRKDNIEENLEKVIKFYVNNTNSSVGHLFLIDSDNDVLNCLSFFSEKKKQYNKIQSLKRSEGSPGWVLKNEQIRIIQDTTKEALFKNFDEEIKSEICLPIIVQNSVLGVMLLNSYNYNNYSDEHIDFLSAASSMIGPYIKNFVNLKIQRPSLESLLANKINFGFVLMPFREPFNKYYTSIIKPAISETGIFPIRADEIHQPSVILKDIYDYIQNSTFILAELTGRNPNVFYELGYSHAIGKKAILITQTIEDIPFDLRGFRHIIYDTTDPDWSDKLRNIIKKYIDYVIKEKL